MSDDAGDVRDSAEPDETLIESPEPSPEAETEFHPFDEVDEDFKPGPAMRVMGQDGLPITVDTTTGSDIPALSLTTLICMGDFSAFVTRDEWGTIEDKFLAQEVDRAPDGRWRVSGALATERSMAKEVGRIQYPSGWVEVQPIRPPCRHFVRQQGSFHLNATHRKHYRLCAARRTTEGTFMSVSDLGMWACDMREPYDVESIKHLDEFDNLKIEQGAQRVHLSIFQSSGIFDAPQQKTEEN